MLIKSYVVSNKGSDVDHADQVSFAGVHYDLDIHGVVLPRRVWDGLSSCRVDTTDELRRKELPFDDGTSLILSMRVR